MTEPSGVAEPAAARRLSDELWGDWRFGLVLTALALVPRLYVAVAWSAEPVWDGHYYHFGATRIAEGLGYSEDVVVDGVTKWRPWCHYPVGYSGFLALFYAMFGSSLLVAPLVNAVVGSLTVFVGHGLASCFLPRGRARLAGVILALHPGLISYTAVVMSELLAGLLALLPIWALVVLGARERRAAVWAGVSAGLAALVRPLPALATLPVLGAALGHGAMRKACRATLWVVAGAALVIAPWTVRNCRQMDGCALISTNGGWNLAIGALTETGRFHALKAEDGCRIVTGQVQQDRCWASIGLRVIERDPARWLGLVDDKLWQMYNHESFAIAYLREAQPRAWPEPEQWRAQEILTVFHHLVMLFAAFGAVARPTSGIFGRDFWARVREPGVVRRALEPPAPGARLELGLLVALIGFVAWALTEPVPPLFWLASGSPLIALLPRSGAPGRGPVAVYLWSTLLITSLTHVLFFGEDRYHIVVSPILAILAASALRAPAAPRSHEREPVVNPIGVQHA